MLSALSRPVIGRSLAVPAAAGLGGVCLIHLLDGPGSLTDVFYVDALELALAAACVPLAVLLVIRPTRPIWKAALGLNVAAMAAFVLSRTTGLPSSTDDIGNRAQTLGGVNLVVQTALIAFAATVIRPRRHR